MINESSVKSLELLDVDKVAVIGDREDYDIEREDFGGILSVYDLHYVPRLTNKSKNYVGPEIAKTEVEFICDGMTIITLGGMLCIAVSTCNG